MAIPDFETIMLPLLEITQNGNECQFSNTVEELANKFKLTEEENKELLPSGKQEKFDNRVGWARTFLKKAGLLESTGRGKFKITKRGLDIIKSKPNKLDVQFLKQFPEFLEFQYGKTSQKNDFVEKIKNEKLPETPEEALETRYFEFRSLLAQDLLEKSKKLLPKLFEKLVVDLLLAMGYGGSRKDAGQAIGQSGDGGIDGIIKEDRLGLDIVYIQAKRWEGSVGRPELQKFAGSLDGQRARKGVFITTSRFTQDAKDYVNNIEKKIVLIDGEMLSQLMIDFNIGVNELATYHIKKIDLDYFEEE